MKNVFFPLCILIINKLKIVQELTIHWRSEHSEHRLEGTVGHGWPQEEPDEQSVGVRLDDYVGTFAALLFSKSSAACVAVVNLDHILLAVFRRHVNVRELKVHL